MLGKLLKYDIKFGYRAFLIMGGSMILTALLLRIVDPEWEWLNNFTLISFMPFIFFGIGIACIVLVFQNFNRNLLSNEGYFMLTLPVKRYKFIVSKLLTSLMWFNFMIAVGFVTVLILLNRNLIGGTATPHMPLMSFLVNILTLNIFAVNGILALYLLAVASNVSIGGKKFGAALGAASFISFALIEVLFLTYIARELFGRLTIWFISVGNDFQVTVSSEWPLTGHVMESLDVSGPMTVSSIDIASTFTMLLFSVLAYCIVAYYLKKRVDLQ